MTDKYKNELVPEYYKVVSQYYSEQGGPFLLGDKITYADFAVYGSIDNNERIGVQSVSGTFPFLKRSTLLVLSHSVTDTCLTDIAGEPGEVQKGI